MKDPFQKRPLPAFFAALCFVVCTMFALTALDQSSDSVPTAETIVYDQEQADAAVPVTLNSRNNRMRT
jgi:hypothetical protein